MEKNNDLLDYKRIIPLQSLYLGDGLTHYAALEITPKTSDSEGKQYIFCHFNDLKGLFLVDYYSVYAEIDSNFGSPWAGQDRSIMKKSLDHLISALEIQLIVGTNSQSGNTKSNMIRSKASVFKSLLASCALNADERS
jgi:hypothetical protein